MSRFEATIGMEGDGFIEKLALAFFEERFEHRYGSNAAFVEDLGRQPAADRTALAEAQRSSPARSWSRQHAGER